MPTPTLTAACEYATGNINNASSATYLRYFMVIPLFFPPALRYYEFAGAFSASAFSSEVLHT
jgi:hypothetical protein